MTNRDGAEMMQDDRKTSRFYLLSKNFKEYWFNYFWQSLTAGVFTFLIIFIFQSMIGAVVLASIGSTVFCVFAMPNNRASQTRNVIGSYIICILIGLVCSLIPTSSISGGLAVGGAALFMVITDTEHPPAAGVALGLALSPVFENALICSGVSLAVAIISSILKRVLSPWLKDLV